MLSRITAPTDFRIRYWKEGPEFLKRPFRNWPIETVSDIPTEELPDRYTVNVIENIEEMDDSPINLKIIDAPVLIVWLFPYVLLVTTMMMTILL